MYLKLSAAVLLGCAALFYLANTSVTEQQLKELLSNKVVLITGASSGIGEEIAYQLAAYNAKLVLVARTTSKLERVRQGALERGSPHVYIISRDLSEAHDSTSVVLEALGVVGVIDYAVLNHGAMPMRPYLSETTHQDLDFISKIFNVNVYSYMELYRTLVPVLEHNAGHIFLTSSLFGEIPVQNAPVYAASKHALNGFFYSVQQELLALSSNVTLTVGNLGLIMTEELSGLLVDGPSIPQFARGDLHACARKIIATLSTRQRTLNYPFVATHLSMFLFNFFPYFQDIMALENLQKWKHFLDRRDGIENYQRGYN